MRRADRKYTKTHEWIEIDGDLAVVGVTDHAQEALGDITFIELPVVGEVVEQGAECGVIESIKAASDMYAPVSGEVAEVHLHLRDRPEVINHDAYGDGWIYKLKDFDAEQLLGLMDAEEYESMLEEEAPPDDDHDAD